MPKRKLFRKSSLSYRFARSGLKTLAVIAGMFFCFAVLLSLYEKQHEGSNPEHPEKQLSEEVIAYKPLVQKYLKQHELEEYTGVVLALMMQESGGRGTDPMQASESYCGERGCIEDPELSIKKGTNYFAGVLEEADGDVKLALQSYNFGRGFIGYVKDRGGEYSEDLAVNYSKRMYKKLKSTMDFRCIREESKKLNACYGDIKYVDAVLAYYEDAKTKTGTDDVRLAALTE
ncbi:lysozyme family protein [Sediminibacillus halophilus]|uniref:Lysozyme-like n=1 Tax=Sediminibacillus halophilus TaxID=482461 RepID=A0A1G9X3D3_9BACI|nr:lysozyme family protein [Sediminibacillus halophilus]SDM90956.1 Lysozyme-like [Sediminibacillus halophilus]